jgi:hypothetical protein
LAGTKGNRLATGRRIKVIAGGMTQTVKIRSGGGYLSQNELRWHFGLSTAAKIDHIEIRWPSKSAASLAIVVQTAPRAVRGGQPPWQ